MVNKDLIDYIMVQISKDRDIIEIRDSLKKIGWKENIIDESIKYAVHYHENGRPSSVFQRFSQVMTNPYQFFKEIKPEKSIRKPISFLVTFSLITCIVIILRWFFLNLNQKTEFGISVLLLAPLAILVLIFFLLIYTFVFTSLTHLFSKLFGNEYTFKYTFKIIVYSLAPLFIAFMSFNSSIFSYVSIPLWVWSLLLAGAGMSETHNLSFFEGITSIFLAYMLFLGVLSVISFVSSGHINGIISYLF